MVNYALVIKGLFFFIIACFVSIIIYLLGTQMMDALTTTGDLNALTTEEQAIIWIGMIIIWVLILIVMPMHYILEGLKERE